MFKFNFAGENNEDKNESTSSKVEHATSVWLKSEKVLPNRENDIIKDIFKNCEENTLECKDLIVKYFSTIDVLNILRTNDECESINKLSVLNADQNHSDLQTAVYEGGLKIWECTYDLINYIVDDPDSYFHFEGKRVLDLGCGTGLIGLLCLLKGSSCTFQDYNVEVLQYITISNVTLNGEDYLNKSKFYSGDWKSFVDIVDNGDEENKFDYIFTSETIYNTENYDKLHTVFQHLLKTGGAIFLAAKSYYFGVGGGTSSFESFLKNKQIFKSESCWTYSEGLKREILRITFI